MLPGLIRVSGPMRRSIGTCVWPLASACASTGPTSATTCSSGVAGSRRWLNDCGEPCAQSSDTPGPSGTETVMGNAAR